MDGSVIVDQLQRRLRILGPGGDPPQPVLDDALRKLRTQAPSLLRLLEADSDQGLSLLTDFAIAYGVTWSRPRSCRVITSDSWEGAWSPALAWLEDQVFDCMHRTSRYLEYDLKIEGYAFCPHPELDRGVAMAIVDSLLEGTCPCAELARENPLGAIDVNFKRREIRCQHQHRVASWNPERCSFLAFVWQALKGALPKSGAGLGIFRPKSLVQGMHYWYLHHLCSLRMASVLVWVCPIDGTLNFEELPCRACMDAGRGQRFDREAFRTTVERLLIPWAAGGRYVELAYWNCQYCRRVQHPDAKHRPPCHFYPETLTLCPKCGHGRGPGARRSHVYVLGPREVILDDTWNRSSSRGSADAPGSEHAGDDARDVAVCSDAGVEIDSRADQSERLETALGALEPLSRHVIDLRFNRSLTRVEVAQKLSLSPGRVRTLETHALQALRARLDAQDEAADDYNSSH